MTERDEVVEVFTNFGEFEIQAMEPEMIEADLRDSYDVELVILSGDEVKLIGTYSNILRALLDFWHPGGSDQEAKAQFIEWLDRDLERY